jgi:hypothetical protein
MICTPYSGLAILANDVEKDRIEHDIAFFIGEKVMIQK